MSFAAAIRRCPIPYDAAAGKEAALTFASQPTEVAEVIAGAAGCSPFLRAAMERERAWLEMALSEDPNQVARHLMQDLEGLPASEVASKLRQHKRRLALYTGLADLAGVWSLDQVTVALTEFADFSVKSGLRALMRPELERRKLPGQTLEDLEEAAGLVVLAMGKMGAHELNYSSDIDLICLFDDSRYPGQEAGDARAVFVRVIRKLTALLSDQTGDGYVWRTDLRLRPDPSVTPVVVAMEAAERYYESLGRTWERAAHIKARPCVGAIAAGAAYLERLRPFVWRRHLDFAAVEDAHLMREKIRGHKGFYDDVGLEGRDLKLGPGGIREIEFFCQTRQLISGGRQPSLRVRRTVDALARLAEGGWVDKATAQALASHYRALREVEHRVQMVADTRTHVLPSTSNGMDRIARMCGEGDTTAWRRALSERLHAVASATDGFFRDRMTDALQPPPVAEPEIVGTWLRYPALRSDRARASFERLKPDLLARLARATKPDEALLAFDGFLSGLPAGVQLFALFEANPQLRALVVDIAAISPALAHYLARNAQVLDAVLGGDFFAPWPSLADLTHALSTNVATVEDYEAKLDAVRRTAKEWHFRVGVHHLRGLIDSETAGAQYADLAEAVLKALFPAVCDEIARKHGPAPGQGAVLLAMGSLGGRALNAKSDLDLILIYDAPGDAMSEGPRPLAGRAYFARLTQALVTAVSVATAEGKLYEVDMRLRPSGRQGPVATSLRAFESYQRNDAWTWEHLALTRARPVAGADAVGEAVEVVRQEVLAQPRDQRKVLGDVADMRARLAEAKAPRGPLDLKAGGGGLRDIELLGQTAALLTGSTERQAPAQVSAAEALFGANGLQEAYTLQSNALGAARLILDSSPDSLAELAQGAQSLLLREVKAGSVEELTVRLMNARQQAEKQIDAALEAST